MKEELSITTERIDDFVVFLALIQQMNLPDILDQDTIGRGKRQIREEVVL